MATNDSKAEANMDNYESSKKGVARWDVFDLPTPRMKRRNDESRFILVPLKFMKLLCYLITFALVLGSSTVANVTLLLMTSQEAPNRTLDLCVQGTNKRFLVNSPAVERMGWVWSLWFIVAISEFIVFVRCAWICIFKSNEKPSVGTFISVFVTETCQIVGVCMLLFRVYPSMSSVQAVMLTSTFGLIPGLLLLLSRKRICVKLAFDIVALACIIGGVGFWAFVQKSWQIPTVAVLISFGWWENFVDEDSERPFLRVLSNIRAELKRENRRYFVFLIVSLWKIVLSFCIMLIYVHIDTSSVADLLSQIPDSFRTQVVMVIQKWQTSDSAIEGVRGDDLYSNPELPIYVALVQIGCAMVCYFVSLFALKICIQEFGFSLPTCLSIPLSVLVMSALCSFRMEDNCYMADFLPKYVFWTCPEGDFVEVFWRKEYGWIWLLWLFSQTWINAHIWIPHNMKMSSTERLFVNPLYNGVIISQSLVFNRRKHRLGKLFAEADKNDADQESIAGVNFEMYETLDSVRPTKKVGTKIYGCATMWHETADEMLEMLKSIMRLDIYLQDNKSIAARKLWDMDPNSVFDFELHIFFDDAFKEEKVTKEVPFGAGTKKIHLSSKMIVNDYVKKFVEVMGKAAAKMYPSNIRTIKPPTKVQTLYGGRLVWLLPGGMTITVHVKNKDLIRHKKRWSQVMYMYYLLGYLMLDPKNDSFKDELETNTYVLALDGDIDFKPAAIVKLLDLMDDGSLGAACGRIHPIGAGPIVWYQKFEYAIGHWLQKATEHVTGCVLCSPGCFSLFRAKALLEVMRTYSTKAEEALHYVQYDQGEDRWLCTLILKRGYRIEYSAASDAYTHAPETFGEFYTQRRRWGPSTLANVLDLLMDYKDVVRINNSISMPYITYQGMIMLGTILGPGTIFLMIVGSIVAAFRIDNWSAFCANIIPVIIFILICFLAKNEWQIAFAMILSCIYALIMVAVLVATAIQLTEDGISSPSGIFLIAIASSFIIAALLHPQEFLCVAHGFLYFLCVPSMYLLLTIYSLINLNVVSWGTREDPAKKAEQEAQKKMESVKKKNALTDVTEWLGFEEDSSFFKQLCQCSFCITEKPTLPEEMKLLEESQRTVSEMSERISGLERSTEIIVETVCKDAPKPLHAHAPKEPLQLATDKKQIVPVNNTPETPAPVVQTPTIKTDLECWADDADLLTGAKQKLTTEENQFWRLMIDKYLLPLDKDEEQEKKAAAELIELRNKVVFAFIMINSLFILIVFLLQMNKETLFVNWPVNSSNNISYIPDTMRIQIDRTFLQLEPIGMVFSVFFGIILFYQFFAMIAHRFGTFTHIMAGTSLAWEFEASQEFNSADLLESDDEDTTNAGLVENNKPPKMPLNPAERSVSEYFIQKHDKDIKKFETLQEANQKQINKKLISMVNIGRQHSGQFKNPSSMLRRLSRNENLMNHVRTQGLISEERDEASFNPSLRRTGSAASTSNWAMGRRARKHTNSESGGSRSGKKKNGIDMDDMMS